MNYPKPRTEAADRAPKGRDHGVQELKPLRGAHLAINEAMHTFLLVALADIGCVYSDERNDVEPELVLDDLLEHEFEGASDLEWQETIDDFGRKVWAATPYDTGKGDAAEAARHPGEFRVGLVIPKNKDFIMIDIRAWGVYEQNQNRSGQSRGRGRG
jgi:hypothetical protein